MKSLLPRLLLVGLGISWAAVPAWAAEGPRADKAKPAIERGKALLDKDEYPAAAQAFSEALRLDPKSVAAYNGRGTSYRLDDKIDQAQADYNEALRLEPQNSEAHCGRVGVYLARKDFKTAIAECDEAIRCDPKNSKAYCWRAFVYVDRGEYDKAFADCTEAVRLNPKDAKIYAVRAAAYARKNELDRAISDFAEAIRLNPKDARAYNNRGTIFAAKGEYDKATADYTEAIRLDPKNCDAYIARGYAYAESNKPEMAIADYTRAIELGPSKAAYHGARGLLYEKLGDTRKAEADFAITRKLALNLVLEKNGLANKPVCKTGADSVEKRIHEKVAKLEYSDAVARDLVAMVRDWKLGVLQQRLVLAQNELRMGRLTRDRVSQTERDIGEAVCQEIAASLRYKEAVCGLDEVTRAKCACCVGFSLAFDVLGRSIGLEVQGLDVPITGEGPVTDDQGHWACLIRLADGRVAIADPTGTLGIGVFVSNPFTFADLYRKKADYWELKDVSNPLGLHRLVQPLDDDGLVGGILTCGAGKWLKSGNPKFANSLVTEAIRRNPNSPQSYLCRAETKAALGHSDLAIADISAAIQHNPLSASAYSCLGANLLFKGQIGDALANLDEAIRVNPKFAWPHIIRGLGHMGRAEKERTAAPPAEENARKIRCELQQSLADFTEAIHLDPKLAAFCYRFRGTVHESLGDSTKALADLSEAIRLDPKDAEALVARIKLYATQRDYEKTIADSDRAIRLNPTLAAAYATRAWARQCQAECDAWFDNTANYSTTSSANAPSGSTATGDARSSKTGTPDQVSNGFSGVSGNPLKVPDAYAETTLSAATGNANSLMSGAAIPTPGVYAPVDVGNPAPPAYKEPSTMIADDVRARRERAERDAIKIKKGRELALADYTEAIRLDPKNAWYYKNRSRIHESLGDIDKALADMSEVIRLDPKDAAAYDRRGELHIKRQEAKKAAADYAQAMQLRSEDDRYR